MKNVITLYKKEGETPLECMDRFRAQNPQYQHVSLTYAGRLDPLACGKLLVLAGDMVHKKEEYCACDKEYYVEALLGLQTDTYDVLGIPQNYKNRTTQELSAQGRQDFPKEDVVQALGFFIEKKEQPYPPYSSRTVNGKPMWQWAREGRLDEIEIPTREVEIYAISDVETREITQQEILDRVNTITRLVTGDFRQDEIRNAWHYRAGSRISSSLRLENSGMTEMLVSFHVKCSSGTYIRTLVHELGKKLGVGACIFRLERTRVIIEENFPQ